MKILALHFRTVPDSYPDLSYLGEYCNEPGPDDRTIDRHARGNQGRNEFRYFVAALSGYDTGNPNSVEEDYERMEAYNRGALWMNGHYWEAEIEIGGTVQHIRSGGLWGVESDSSPEYIEEIRRDEFRSLYWILVEMSKPDDDVRSMLETLLPEYERALLPPEIPF